MNNELEQKIKDIFSLVFKVDVDIISEKSSIGDLPNWDSLNHMKLVAVLEETFDINLTETDISSMTSFGLVYFTVDSLLNE